MGWAEGLNAGINLGNVIKQGMLQQDLADEAKKYKVTEGAYGPGLSENLQGVISARDQALQGLGENATPEQIQQVHAQYTPAMTELSRRVGLTAPDYAVGGQNFATMQEAQSAANAQRTMGLADVYRQHGQIDKASELEARAQQQELTGLQLGKAKRESDADIRMGKFNEALNALENPTTDEIKALAAEHKLDRKQQFDVAAQITGIAKNELEAHDIEITKAVKGKTLEQLIDLHKNDKRFNDGFHFVQAKGKDGQVVLNLVSDADPGTVIRSQAFSSPAMATAYLRKEAEDPGNVADWLLGVRGKEASAALHEGEVGLLPAKKAYYGALAGAAAGKPDAAITAAENKAFTELTKSDAWKAAERKGDRNAMNELMVGRGLDPAKHGAQGAVDWKPAKPAADAKPAEKKTGVDTSKAAAKDTKYTPPEPSDYVKSLRATPEQKAAAQAQALEIERLKEEERMRARAAIAADFDRKYRVGLQ